MKKKIFITEFILQTLLTAGSILFLLNEFIKTDEISEFFIALLLVGAANLAGFLIRISLITSKYHRYYFFGVALFFISLYILIKLSFQTEFIMNFMGIGGSLFNLYYLLYGYFLIKNSDFK